MAVYFFIYLFSVCFAICYSKSKENTLSLIFKTLCFVTLFLPAAIRFGIGTDFGAYYHYIDIGYYGSFEIGWVPLARFIHDHNIDIQWFFVISSFFTILIAFETLEKKYFYVTIPVFICMTYLESYNQIRQVFASTLFLVSVKNFCEGKKIKAIIWACICILFHSSAFVFIFIISISNFKWKKLSRINNIILFFLIYLIFDFLDFLSIIMRLAIYTPYAEYLESAYYFSKTKMGSGLGVLLKELIILIVIIIVTRTPRSGFVNRNERTIQGNSYKIVCISLFILLIFYILGTKIFILGRLSNLFLPFHAYVIQTVAKSKSKYRKLVVLFFLLLYFMFYYMTIKSGSIETGNVIIPYRTFFNK